MISRVLVEPLSRREVEVLSYVARGLSDAEIAMELGLSWRTINNHVEKATDKLYCRRRIEAVVKALLLGIISIDAEEVEVGHGHGHGY